MLFCLSLFEVCFELVVNSNVSNCLLKLKFWSNRGVFNLLTWPIMHFVNYLYDNYLCLLIRNLHSTHNITLLFLIIVGWILLWINKMWKVVYIQFFICLFDAFIGCVDKVMLKNDFYVSSSLFYTTFRDSQKRMRSVLNQQMVYTCFQHV